MIIFSAHLHDYACDYAVADVGAHAPPRLLLQVCSCDSWGMQRLEGYGYVDVPLVPGELKGAWCLPGFIFMGLTGELVGLGDQLRYFGQHRNSRMHACVCR